MNLYIVKIKGHQYKVKKNDILSVEKIDKKKGAKFNIEEVLLAHDGDKTQVGKPLLKDIKIQAEIIEHYKGSKVEIVKFKKKNRYLKRSGHRQNYTRIKIL